MKETRALVQNNLGLFISEVHKFWVGYPSKDFGVGRGSGGGGSGCWKNHFLSSLIITMMVDTRHDANSCLTDFTKEVR